jgi:hypothetical protein
MFGVHPVSCGIDIGHCKQNGSDEMSKDKVEKDDLEKFVILIPK